MKRPWHESQLVIWSIIVVWIGACIGIGLLTRSGLMGFIVWGASYYLVKYDLIGSLIRKIRQRRREAL